MTSNFGILILIMLLNSCFCSIIIANKLTKKIYLTIRHDLLLSGLEQPLLKVQLNFVQLSNACTIPKIPQSSKLFSVQSTTVHRRRVLVVQEDNDDCDISQKISQAKNAGYSGIIFCTNSIQRFLHITPVEGFYASVIVNNDRFSLSHFDAARYIISIYRDTSLLEDFCNCVRLCLDWIIGISKYFEAGILLALTPAIILCAIYFLTPKRQSPYQAWDESWYPRRDESWHPSNDQSWENDSDYSSESDSYANDDMFEHRKTLNVGQNAGTEEINRAFRSKAIVLHSDKNVDVEEKIRREREEEFKKCLTAKMALLDALEKLQQRR